MLHAWVTGIIVLKWMTGAWLLWRMEGCGEPDAEGLQGSKVSVIIPARNEERNLPKVLSSLARQTLSPHEVIVVNDHSTDHTAQIAQDARARLLSAEEPPPGWIGKTWACWTGAQASTGTLLLFLDADTELAPSGLWKMVSEYHRRGGGFLSLYPYHRMKRPYERLSAFLQLVSVMGMGIASPVRSLWKNRNAFGQCLLFGRGDYFSVGGHEVVKASILEGPAFGERFYRRGLAVNCLAGRGAIELQMYPEGLRQLIDGWSKNFGNGMKVGGWSVLLLVTLWLSGCFDAFTIALKSCFHPGGIAALWALGIYAAFGWQIHRMLRRLGNFGFMTALAFPIPLLFFVFVFAYWVVLTLVFGRVRWRGRSIPVRRFFDTPSTL